MSGWSNDDTMAFLEAYQSEPCIWNPKDVNHKDRKKVADAWSRLSQALKKPVKELKAKKEILMTTFRKQFKKKQDIIRSSASTEVLYQPCWFAYQFMESFLLPVYTCNYTLNTETITFAQKQEEECLASPGDSYQTSPNLSADTIEEIFIAQPPRSINRRNNSQTNTLNFSNDMSNVICRKQKKDDFSIFGEVVASELRDLKTRKQVLELKKRIMNLIYETKINNLEDT